MKIKSRKIDITKETQEERKERVKSNYFRNTLTRVVESKKKYNRQKFKNEFQK